MLCQHCKRLCLTVVAILSQLFCEMWSRRRFSSDAVSILLHLRRVTAATARVCSYSLCCFGICSRAVSPRHLSHLIPSLLQPTLRLNLILEIAKAACSGIVCERTIFSGVHHFIC